MPTQFEGHFEQARKEWTARKHKVLGQYVRVAIAKLKNMGSHVALVDGYAGENRYGSEHVGSTRTMVIEAQRAHELYGTEVKVLACEADKVTYDALCASMKQEIASGLLTVLFGTHRENLPRLLELVGQWPTVVFLDPNKPDQMIVEDDIKPWADRRGVTDILGTYFGGSVARMVGGAKKGYGREKIEAIVGPGWQEMDGETEAYQHFLDQIRPLKKFAGIYLLRKKTPNRIAYGVFGLSANEHGIALLSDAVARDFGLLIESRASDETPDMFEDDPSVNVDAWWYGELVKALRPVLLSAPTTPVRNLPVKLFAADARENMRFFGRFKESQFGRARREILKENKDA